MARATDQNALTGLDNLIAETRARLEANPDFVALNALQKARAEIVGVKGAMPTAARVVSLVDYPETPSSADGELMPKKVPQLAAAAQVLEKIGHPLAAEELMDGALKGGAVITSTKPLVSFSSSLSKSEKFRSVRWKGKYAWWFADRPVPPASLSRRIAREVVVEREAAE